MPTKPQIHASFLKTLSIYYYFLFFLLNSVAKKILRTTPALSLCPRYAVEFIPKGGNNEPFKLFMQNKPNLLDTQMNVTSVTQKLLEHSSPHLTNKVYTNVDPVLRHAVEQIPVDDWF